MEGAHKLLWPTFKFRMILQGYNMLMTLKYSMKLDLGEEKLFGFEKET